VASPDFRKPDRLTMWDFVEKDDEAILESDIFDDAESEAKLRRKGDDFWSRLPMAMRYQLAQLECNLRAAKTVPPHRALRDWMVVVLPLLYHEWDAKRFEDGGHRTATDGFKRNQYLGLLKKCQVYANAFDDFQQEDCYYEMESDSMHAPDSGLTVSSEPTGPRRKRRRVAVNFGSAKSNASDLIFVSRAIVGLRLAIKAEMAKRAPPPVRISFS
jgi:hypothetical protein